MLLGNMLQDNYAKVQVNANASVSSKFELICMLHDKLITHLDSLVFHIESKNYEEKAVVAQKAIDILVALDASLDLENTNELISRIHQLYEHCIATIFTASKDLNADLIPPLRATVLDLKEGWEGAMEHIGG